MNEFSENLGTLNHQRYEEDCRKILENMIETNAKVDGSITDPPYPQLEKHRAVGTTTRLVTDWFPTMTMAEIGEVFGMVYDVLKRHKHFYVFSNALALPEMLDRLPSQGFDYNNLLIWDKGKMGMGYSYRGQCEFIIFCSKGPREKLKKNPVHIFRRPKRPRSPPYAKPWLLYRDILLCCAAEGDLFLDPWAGTDPLTRATRDLRLHSISIDLKFQDEVW